jgi:hypothetical protein
MRIRLRHVLSCLVAAGVAATALLLPQSPAAAAWPPPCPNGSNWDNSACR